MNLNPTHRPLPNPASSWMRAAALWLLVLLSPLSAVTASAKSPDLEVARLRFSELQSKLQDIDERHVRLSMEHERLASQIASAKASPRAPLLPGVTNGDLRELLKHAQPIAEDLETLDRELAATRAAIARARQTLRAAIDVEIATARRALASGAPSNQRARFEVLRRLIAERELLQASPTAPAGDLFVEPAVELSEIAHDEGGASSDELRELADEASDREEQLRDHLLRLSAHLETLENRRRLLRAEADSALDEMIFGESERGRRLARTTVAVPTGRADQSGTASGKTAGTSAGAGPANVLDGADSEAGVVTGEGSEAGPQALPPASAGEADSDGHEAPQAASDGDDAADPSFSADNAGERGAGAAYGPDGDGAAEAPGDSQPEPEPGGWEEPLDPASEITPPSVPMLPPAAAAFGPESTFSPAPESNLVEPVVDPELLTGHLDGLSLDTIQGQIRRLNARKHALEKQTEALRERRDGLEKKAREREDE